jgi:hypothetical protein
LDPAPASTQGREVQEMIKWTRLALALGAVASLAVASGADMKFSRVFELLF